jgi:hypothetical protein
MKYKLFLDDERYPPDDDIDFGYWRIARNFHDAVWYVKNYGIPYHIAFDHDLGYSGNFMPNPSGMDFAKWFCNHLMDNDIKLHGQFTYSVHSMNPVGAKNIDMYMAQYLRDYQ